MSCHDRKLNHPELFFFFGYFFLHRYISSAYRFRLSNFYRVYGKKIALMKTLNVCMRAVFFFFTFVLTFTSLLLLVVDVVYVIFWFACMRDTINFIRLRRYSQYLDCVKNNNTHRSIGIEYRFRTST